MDSRQKRDLDNFITGHYGEDQFKKQDETLNDETHCEICGEPWQNHSTDGSCAENPFPEDIVDDFPNDEVVN